MRILIYPIPFSLHIQFTRSRFCHVNHVNTHTYTYTNYIYKLQHNRQTAILNIDLHFILFAHHIIQIQYITTLSYVYPIVSCSPPPHAYGHALDKVTPRPSADAGEHTRRTSTKHRLLRDQPAAAAAAAE